MRVAIADGAGAPTGLAEALPEAAASVGDISVLLGWCLEAPIPLDSGCFREIRTIMGGFGLRRAIADRSVRYVPERLSALPSLLSGPLRPDLLIMALPGTDDGWSWGTEIAWMGSLIAAGVPLLIEHNDQLPRTGRPAGLPVDRGSVICRTDRPPAELASAAADDATTAIARTIASLVPAGASLQYGPGPIADALAGALQVPVRVRSGMITDAVVTLERRGLLLDEPSCGYVVGTSELYRWADGRRLTDRLEHTHLSMPAPGEAVVTVNSALEIDQVGQINVETAAGKPISGIGGHPDFSLAGHRSVAGLSIIAVPTMRAGRPTLVERLSAPVSTLRSDVDVVVTELGAADLRGLDDAERAVAIRSLWPATVEIDGS